MDYQIKTIRISPLRLSLELQNINCRIMDIKREEITSGVTQLIQVILTYI